MCVKQKSPIQSQVCRNHTSALWAFLVYKSLVAYNINHFQFPSLHVRDITTGINLILKLSSCLVNSAESNYANSKTPTDRRDKLNALKLVKSLQSIGIHHKPVNHINTNFPRDWFQNWVEKLFDLIVLSKA